MALKHTDAELELITDPDAYLMLETNLRGGIATISKRYAPANNKHVEGYEDSEESRYITYLDANGLYATALSQPLPVGNFRFLDEIEIEKFLLSIASRRMGPSDILLNVIWRIQITFTMHTTTIRWLRSISRSLSEWVRRV